MQIDGERRRVNLSLGEWFIAISAFMVVLFFSLSYQTGRVESDQYTPLILAAQEAQHEVAAAQRLIEDSAGDSVLSASNGFWSHLSRINWIVSALLQQTESGHSFIPDKQHMAISGLLVLIEKKSQQIRLRDLNHVDTSQSNGQQLIQSLRQELIAIDQLLERVAISAEQTAHTEQTTPKFLPWFFTIGSIVFAFCLVFNYRKHEKPKLTSDQRGREQSNATHLLFDQLQHVINGARLGYWDWDYITGGHYVNDRWLDMLGLTRSEISNSVSDWNVRIHPADKKRMSSLISSHIESGESYRAEFRMRHKRGHWIWIEGSGRVVEWDGKTGDPIRLCGTHQDISQRKRDETYIRESERCFRELIESLPSIAVQGYSSNRRVIFWNRASEALYGYSKDEVIGRRIEALILPNEIREEFCLGFTRWIERGEKIPDQEFILADKFDNDISVHTYHLLLSGVDDRPELYRIDIDLRKEKRERQELGEKTCFDLLTHLPNKYLLNSELRTHIEEACRFERELAVLFVDIDCFTDVNSTYGYDVGDKFLKQLEQHMTRVLREYDVLVRYGGDEFILILPSVQGREDVAYVAEKLCNSADRIFRVNKLAIHTAFSIGMSLYPSDSESPSELLKNADAAMYEAKKAGKNCCRFFTKAPKNV